MTILEFMSDSPILTFFLVAIVAECIYECVRAIFNSKPKKDK